MCIIFRNICGDNGVILKIKIRNFGPFVLARRRFVNILVRNDVNTCVINFYSDRVPVWGDFYAKGGRDSYLYNAGYLAADPLAPAASGSLNNHILRPDSVVIPVPSAVLLSSIGLGLAGWLQKRRTL